MNLPAPPVRVLVVDDNLIARLGIVSLLEAEPGFAVVGEAAGGAQAVEAYRRLRPDVVLSDLRMPVLDGAQTTALLAKETPPARVLVLSQHDSDEDVHRALSAGAQGYLTKDVSGPELAAALRVVAAGGTYLPAAIEARQARRQTGEALTARERTVLRLLFLGRSNRQIATEMALAAKTVEGYVSSLLFKLGATNRTDAIRIALERGLLSTEP